MLATVCAAAPPRVPVTAMITPIPIPSSVIAVRPATRRTICLTSQTWNVSLPRPPSSAPGAAQELQQLVMITECDSLSALDVLTLTRRRGYLLSGIGDGG